MTDEQVRIMARIIMALTEIKFLEKQLVIAGQYELASQIGANRTIIGRNILLFLDTLEMDHFMAREL